MKFDIRIPPPPPPHTHRKAFFVHGSFLQEENDKALKAADKDWDG